MDGDGGKRAVVTGASSGIGREIAIQLAAPGGEIWLIGRDVERLNEVAELVQSKGATHPMWCYLICKTWMAAGAT